jgi:hypothetical protein
MPKWTVGIVNWKTVDYLYYQCKTLYEFNDDFELIIVDNTFPNQTNSLEAMREEFGCKVLYHDGETFQTHGTGLNKILSEAKSQYILLQDPDFFWLKQGHLKFLQSFLENGNHAVGASFAHNNFPAVYGASFILDEIKDLDMSAIWRQCPNCQQWHFVDVQMDVGYEIKIRLKNKPFVSFPMDKYQTEFLGLPSFKFDPQCFMYNNSCVAVHFFRGEYPIEDPTTPIPDEWVHARRAYSKYFFEKYAGLS